MNRKAIRQKQKFLERSNKNFTNEMKQVPRELWPDKMQKTESLLTIFRNKKFLAQVYKEKTSIRISVNRTKLNGKGAWSDEISWDELQEIKRQIGFGNMMAVEVYPKDSDIVNVANMRHLWLVDDKTNIGWRKN